jgi:hypothetical protein
VFSRFSTVILGSLSGVDFLQHEGDILAEIIGCFDSFLILVNLADIPPMATFQY